MSYAVLVVDDSAIVRSIVRKVLGLTTLPIAQVHEAADGYEALSVLARTPVDLVLTDVHMPGITGAELVRAMRRDPALAGVPVVVVSSDRVAPRMEELRAHGACAYVTKPFRPEQLDRVVREVLGLREVRRAD